MSEPLVIHVDENDSVLGYVPKLQAHQEGLLHRAVSILLFNDKGDWLLQKRADHKYHSGGLWSNTCCSHPYPEEEVQIAAERRLIEEMGISCSLKKMYSFTYRAELDNDLTEHEIDHLFFGKYEGAPKLNPDEVSDWKFITFKDLEKDLNDNPENYTQWFKLIFSKVRSEYHAENDSFINFA